MYVISRCNPSRRNATGEVEWLSSYKRVHVLGLRYFFFNSVIRCFVEKLVISLELYKGGTAHIRIWDYNIIAFKHDSGKFRRTILPMHGILLL